MLKRSRFLFFVISFLSVGFLFLSLPEKGFSGLAQPGPECCQVSENECYDFGGGGGGDGPIQACIAENVVPGVCNESTGVCELISTRPIPALGEWGMAAVVIALGAAGFIFYRRRRSPA